MSSTISLSKQQSAESAFITHVEAEGPFVKIYVQKKNPTNLAIIQKCIESLRKTLEQERSPEPGTLFQDDQVLARFEDGTWYRGVVVSMGTLDCYGVKFVDYGNVEMLEMENIRLLRTLVSEGPLINTPPLAHQMFVAKFVAENMTCWENCVDVEKIKQQLQYKKVKCTKVFQVGDYTFCIVQEDGSYCHQLLAKLKLGILVEVEEQMQLASGYVLHFAENGEMWHQQPLLSGEITVGWGYGCCCLAVYGKGPNYGTP
jgi:hypothetical protein